MSDLLTFALRYARLGWHIFPLRKILNTADGSVACSCAAGAKCPSIGKHPAIKWKTEASCDPATVRGWWSVRFAGCGIGCATGPSGLVVADADGPQGVLTLRGLAGTGPLVTARAKTARGYHVFMRGEAPSSSDPVTKLDIRSTGGFVVLAPSPHASGHVYSWEVAPWDVPVAGCPAPILEHARTKKKTRRDATGLVGRSMSRTKLNGPPGSGGVGLTLPDYLACASEDFGDRLGAILEDWTEVGRALACIPPDCGYQDWLAIGMALHSTGVDQGFELWDAWSCKCKEKYPGRETLQEKWNTFQKRQDGIGLGTLFDLALRHGYKRGGDKAEQKPAELHPPEHNKNNDGQDKAHVNGEANGVNYALPRQIGGNPIWVDWTGGKNPKPAPTCRNVRVALRSMGIDANYNQFNHRMHVGGQVLGQWGGELSDNAVQALRSVIQREFDFDPPTQAMRDATEQECLDNAFHPIKDYFESLQWDGQARIDSWLPVYLSAEDNPFNRAVSRLWLLAGVRRIMQPGCKFDQMPVFEAPEGRGKSTALEILAGGKEYYSDTDILSASNQQQMELIAGKWIYEFGELTGIHGADVNKIKAFISRTVDRGRRAWGRYAVEQPRVGIFAGTTNDPAYLVSQTGNRRFWPVKCGTVDLDGLARDRDQLWAEAVAMERNASLFLPESLWSAAAEVQEGRMLEHPWVDVLRTVVGYREPLKSGGAEMRVAIAELIGVVGIKEGDRQLWHTRQIMGCMIRLGWTFENSPIKIQGKACRGFSREVTSGLHDL